MALVAEACGLTAKVQVTSPQEPFYTVGWYEVCGPFGTREGEGMSDPCRRLARRVTATLGVAAVALAIVPAAPSAAMTVTAANVIVWYSDTGIPIINGLAKASTDFSKGQYVTGCTMFETVASKALTEPSPPDATIAFHWGIALGFYIAGGDDSVQGLQQADKPFVTAGAKYVNDGATQMATVEHEVEHCAPGSRA